MNLGEQLGRLSKDTLAFGVGAAIQKFIVFLLFPIYARLLSKEDFGAQDLVTTVVTMVALFLVLGMDSGTVLHYYEAPESEQAVLRSTWLWSQVLLSIPVCGALMFFATPICRLLFDRPELAGTCGSGWRRFRSVRWCARFHSCSA